MEALLSPFPLNPPQCFLLVLYISLGQKKCIEILGSYRCSKDPLTVVRPYICFSEKNKIKKDMTSVCTVEHFGCEIKCEIKKKRRGRQECFLCAFVNLRALNVGERQLAEGHTSLSRLIYQTFFTVGPAATDDLLPHLLPPGWPGCHRTRIPGGWRVRWEAGLQSAAVCWALCSSPPPRWSSSTPCGSPSSAALCCKTACGASFLSLHQKHSKQKVSHNSLTVKTSKQIVYRTWC